MTNKKTITDKEIMDFYRQNHLLDEAAVATPIVADGEVEKTLPVEEEPDLARSFNRNYNVYFSSQGYGTTFMNDNNWHNETSLTVTFYSSQGPTSLGFVVTAVNKTTGEQQLFYLGSYSPGYGGSMTLPWSGNCTFSVWAISEAGYGNATIKVILA